MTTSDRPTTAIVHDLLSDWAQHRDRILSAAAPSSYDHRGWINLAPMPRTVEVVTALVMSPDVTHNGPLLRTLLDGLGPPHWPLVHAAHVRLLHHALESWVVASTLSSADRCALAQVFLDTGSPAGGDLSMADETPLHQAVRLQDVALVRTLLAAGASAQERRPVPSLDVRGQPSLTVTRPEQFLHKRLPGETLLHLAAIQDDVPMCELLIELGVPLDASQRPDGSPGRSPAQAARDNDSHAALSVIEAVLLRAAAANPPTLQSNVAQAGVARSPRRL